jgi:hypothetical protein
MVEAKEKKTRMEGWECDDKFGMEHGPSNWYLDHGTGKRRNMHSLECERI